MGGNVPPVHLDGSMPGDFGFDPLRLGSDPEILKWFREAELQHCRWAMLGSLPFPIRSLIAVQFLLMHYVEIRRWRDFRKPGSVDNDPIFQSNKLPSHEVGYPGGIFDPLALYSGDAKNLKEKEIKN